MLTNILIGLLAYGVFLVLACWMWHRHCELGRAYDRAIEEVGPDQDVSNILLQATPRIVSAGVRPYPE